MLNKKVEDLTKVLEMLKTTLSLSYLRIHTIILVLIPERYLKLYNCL